MQIQLSRYSDAFSFEDYLEDMAKPFCYGSGAELYALAQVLKEFNIKVNIIIWRWNGRDQDGKDQFDASNDPPITCGEGFPEVHVALNRHGNHFDAKAPPPNEADLEAACAAALVNSSSDLSSSSSSSSSST